MLTAPAGDATRPTADRVRQAVFDMLLHAPWGGRDVIEGAIVLDVFAGTGAMGLEALSRGAAHVTFIENAQAALTALRANIRALKAEAMTTVLAVDATRLGTGNVSAGGRRREPEKRKATAAGRAGVVLDPMDAVPPVMAGAGPPSTTSLAGRAAVVDGGPAPAMTRGNWSVPVPATLVFLDPPYGRDLVPHALDRLRAGGWITPDTLIVAETGRGEPSPCAEPLAERIHGAARVSVWREAVSSVGRTSR